MMPVTRQQKVEVRITQDNDVVCRLDKEILFEMMALKHGNPTTPQATPREYYCTIAGL